MNSVRFDREEGGGLLLAIDTSGPLCAAGLYDGPVERARIVLDLGRGHAERVIDACTDALRAGGAGWGDVARIAVTVGPGSFTGIRAGVAAARGLALSLGVPAIGVTTLEAMDGPPLNPYAVALDARRGQLYAQAFGAGGDALSEPMVDAPDALARRLPSGVASIVGSGAPALVAAMEAAGRDARVGERDGRSLTDAQPDIAAVASHAVRAGELAGRGGRPPVPLYLRGADAKLPGGIEPGPATGAASGNAMPPPASSARIA